VDADTLPENLDPSLTVENWHGQRTMWSTHYMIHLLAARNLFSISVRN